MKKIISLILAIIFCFGLIGCSKKQNYKDNVTCKEIALEIQKVTDSPYRKAEADFANFNLKGASDICTDYVVFKAEKDTNMNEFGVFHALNSKNAKEVAKICESYLEKKNANWNPDYLPEEYPKVKDAKVFTYGNYVVYMVLNESDRTNVNNTVISFLSEGK